MLPTLVVVYVENVTAAVDIVDGVDLPRACHSGDHELLALFDFFSEFLASKEFYEF